MKNKSDTYNDELRREYLFMLDRIGMNWLSVFDTPPEDKTFWDTGYWDLLTKLWKAEAGVKRTDAMSYIAGKTAPTAAKYLNAAIEKGFIIQCDNPDHARSKLVKLSKEMRQRLNVYLDSGLTEIETFAGNAKGKSKPGKI